MNSKQLNNIGDVKMEKELCKVPCIKYFENDNFTLKYDENENIILNSINHLILLCLIS